MRVFGPGGSAGFGRAVGLVAVAAALSAGPAARFVGRSWRKVFPAPPLPIAFRFEEAGPKLGITFRWQGPKLDVHGNDTIAFVGSGAAVADFDGDGWMDLFLPNAAQGTRNHLYLNQKGTGFKEAAAAWGVADNPPETAVSHAMVFDPDNDGRPDMLLMGLGCLRLMRNAGGRFVDGTRAAGLAGDCRNAVASIPLDFDEDGHLDFYLLRFWRDTNHFRGASPFIFPENSFDAQNGGTNAMYRNQGDGTFKDVTALVGGADTHYSWDAQFGDFGDDGRERLYVANDYGQDTIYEMRGHRLVDVTSELINPERRNGMDVTLMDLDGSGRAQVYVSNVHNKGYVDKDNFLWDFAPEGLKERAFGAGVSDCGWAWGGAAADFDLDGRQDLYVANGFITGKPEAGRFNFAGMVLSSLPGFLMSDARRWPRIGDRSWEGNQVDCVFLNRGDRFQRVSNQVGIHEAWDGRAAALVDFDNDGGMDLLVTTRNGPAHLLKNTVEPQGRWIGFRLIGKASNRDAVGARLRLRRGDRRWFQWGTGGHSGFLASSDPRFHFGLPSAGLVDLDVAWPSGEIQTLTGLRSGRYHTVREGEARP